MNMNELIDLLKKSLQLTEAASREQTLSNIEKDILLSNIRKMYDLTLELQTGTKIQIQPHEPEKAPSVVELNTAPAPAVVDSADIEPIAEKPAQEQNSENPAEQSISEAEVVATESHPIVTPAEPEVAEVIEEEITPPAPKPQPSFDELVSKVKEQFNEPKQKQVLVAPEEEDDVPVFFSDLKFDKLFDTEYARELSERLSAARIDDIGRAMGLNEKIFTVNELFKGDSGAFDAAVRTLQSFATFDQAKQYIVAELAPKYEWLSPEKFKKAREFIKIVKRKFA